MTVYSVGLDTRSTTSTIVVVDEDGELVTVKETFPTCKQALEEVPDLDGEEIQVHLEASTIHRDLVRVWICRANSRPVPLPARPFDFFRQVWG